MAAAKKGRKALKVIGIAVGCLLAAFVAFYAYVMVAYGHVESSLRFKGYIYNLFTQYDSAEAMIEGTPNTMGVDVEVDEALMTLREEYIPSSQGGDDIRVLVFTPVDPEPGATCVFWTHGGGYVGGSIESAADRAEFFMGAANTVVVSTDYTLSQVKPYPQALYDVYDALVWTRDHAEELGINPSQIFIGGDSAGGGLTTALALYARDKGEVSVAFQMPLYPMMNDRMDTPSAQDNTEFLWNTKNNTFGWQIYLGDLFGTDDVPKYASAARETDYAGLPPCYTFVGTLDPFYDDTLNYVAALNEAGIDATCDVYEGAFHGFDQIGVRSDLITEMEDNFRAAYRYAVEHYFAEQG